MAVSLIALAGLPPLPLFVSELMILLGGIDAGLLGATTAAAAAARPRLPRPRPRPDRGPARRAAARRRAALALRAARSAPAGRRRVGRPAGAQRGRLQPARLGDRRGPAAERRMSSCLAHRPSRPASASSWSRRRAGLARGLRAGDRGRRAILRRLRRRLRPRARVERPVRPRRRRRACSARDVAGAVDSIVDLAPAADWDEREAHDRYGLRLRRPRAAAAAGRSTTPRSSAGRRRSTGEGVHQVAVGPIHAGVIESGHFRFHVVGERILRARPAPLLQAPRARARPREGAARRRRSPTRSAPAAPARSPTRSPTRRRARRSRG